MIREFHLPLDDAIEAGDIARRCPSSPPLQRHFPGVYNPELPGCPNTLRIDEYVDMGLFPFCISHKITLFERG